MYVNNLHNYPHKLKPHDDLAWLICFAISVQFCTLYTQYYVCGRRSHIFQIIYSFSPQTHSDKSSKYTNNCHVSHNTMWKYSGEQRLYPTIQNYPRTTARGYRKAPNICQ